MEAREPAPSFADTARSPGDPTPRRGGNATAIPADPAAPVSMPGSGRGRAGLLALLGVGLVLLLMWGPEISFPSPAPAEPPLPGVRARTAVLIVRPGVGEPVGELAGIALDPASGQVVATDKGRQSIVRWDPSGQRLAEWGPNLEGAQRVVLGEPSGVTVAVGGTFVVDRNPERLIRLDSAGRVQQVVDLKPYGPYGLNGVAVDRDGTMFVADTGRNRLLQLDPAGRLVKEIGRSGKELGQFTQPMQLGFGPDGSLLVSDWENARVERFDPTLTATDQWPTAYRSYGLTVDLLGRVYVSDSDRKRVQVFTPRAGSLLGELGTAGTLPLDVPGLTQLAVGRPLGGVTVLYAMGPRTIARVELEDTPPPPPSAAGGSLGDLVDPSTLAFAAGVGLVAALVAARRRRQRQGRLHMAVRSPGMDWTDQ